MTETHVEIESRNQRDSERRNEPAKKQGRAIRCDLCGQEALSVHRVALDGPYDRLRKPHRVLYACPPCSEKKERRRLGLDRS